MGSLRSVVAVIAAAGLFVGCGSSAAPGPSVPPPTPTPEATATTYPATGTATAADGTAIAYRDWGGEGPPLVLLTGLGDTAAVYDDLASRLVEDHRVVGITRRGFGESGRTVEGYDYATRIGDDLAVLDELGIAQAVFIGHSIAGDELVVLAAEHPDRTAGVVFLDAAVPQRIPAIDLPTCISQAQLWIPGWLVGPDDPVQSGVEQAELVFGFPLPEVFATEVAGSYVFEDGVQRYTGSPGARQAIEAFSSANPLDYSRVGVPALSLAALSNSLQTALPWMVQEGIPEVDRAAAQACTDESIVVLQQAAFDAVAAANPAISAQQWEQTHHYLFLQQPDRTAAAIGQWLAGQ